MLALSGSTIGVARRRLLAGSLKRWSSSKPRQPRLPRRNPGAVARSPRASENTREQRTARTDFFEQQTFDENEAARDAVRSEDHSVQDELSESEEQADAAPKAHAHPSLDGMSICRGCGAKFQSEFESAPGFVPADKLRAFIAEQEETKAQLEREREQKAQRKGFKEAQLRLKNKIKAARREGNNAKLEQLEKQMDALLIDAERKGVYHPEVSLLPEHEQQQRAAAEQSESTPPSEQPSADNRQLRAAAAAGPMPASPEAAARRYLEVLNPGLFEPNAAPESFANAAGAARASPLAAASSSSSSTAAQRPPPPSGIPFPREMPRGRGLGAYKLPFAADAREDLSEAIMQGLVPDEAVSWLDERVKRKQPLRCQRCHQLAHYGGSQGAVGSVASEDFRAMLRARFQKKGARPTVVLKLVDMFDFNGSMVKNFRQIVGGSNPVILVGNKVDLLPEKASLQRVRAWLKHEAKQAGLYVAGVGLISATTGEGVPQLMAKAKSLVSERAKLGFRDIFIVGTTNVGKSTLINTLIRRKFVKNKGTLVTPEIDPWHVTMVKDAEGKLVPKPKDSPTQSGSQQSASKSNAAGSADDERDVTDAEEAEEERIAAELARKRYPKHELVTTSLVPGTTLGLVAFPLIPKRLGTVFDTPGVLNRHQLSCQLNIEELKAVLPKRRVKPVTYRLRAGKSLLLGGFARIDMLEGAPFFFTICTSNGVVAHVTDTSKVESYFDKHVGTRLFPPFTKERAQELGLMDADPVDFSLHGRGWLESCSDVVFPGVGWVSLTGVGPIKVRTFAAGGTHAVTREPLMPYDARTTTKRWMGAPNARRRPDKRASSSSDSDHEERGGGDSESDLPVDRESAESESGSDVDRDAKRPHA